MDQSFFTGYRRNITRPDEVLLSITIPYSHKGTYFRAIKQARRRDDDIAIVNAAFNVELDEESVKVKHAVLAFGGMAPTTVEAKNTAKILQGRQIFSLLWEPSLIEDACNALVEDLPLSPDAPGGMIAYRRSLTLSMFYKYFVDIYQKLSCKDPKLEPLPENEVSAAQKMKNIHPKSSQYFQVVPNGQPIRDSVGRPIVHASAFKQATGEAVYCDDLPHFENELYLSLVLSTRAHAKIVSVDASQALELNGVHAFFSAKDLPPERNRAGPIIHDEEIFISSKKAKSLILYLARSGGGILGYAYCNPDHKKIILAEPSQKHKTQFFAAIVEMLHWFAGKQIRNVAAVGGNIMTGSPISDLNPIFIAARCKLELISTGKVTSVGQVIGAIVAENQQTAQQASKLVKICYEDLKPVIVTIEDAIKFNSYFKNFERHLSDGNIEEGFRKSDHVLNGEIHIGGQEHFYLETNCTIAVPKGEDDEMEVFSSTQNPSESQKLIAMALGVPYNRIICRTKRMGGGFGGKESRTLMSALPVAIAAHR
ncbi:hypothetical protein J437_LFUL005072 [Ladona fulva]|uniref:Xanthine dehydrogenase n=1 Tax=Ladona fulva TaxID=123851 RepID=A0A8K0P7L1_LADFU|nr:hypothetical protein J437_LFUL005072 [Ladona fulva]